MIIILKRSNRKNKKWMVKVDKRTIHFGDSRYKDFTQHKDLNRRRLYILRHQKNEDWTKTGIKTAGFWSYWLLWNKSTIEESKRDISRKFKLNFS